MMNNQNENTAGINDDALMEVENVYWVELRESLDRLKNNEDFKKVILEAYFKDKAINGVSMLATDYVKQSGTRGDIMEALVAISRLEDFFSVIDNLGAIPEIDED